MWVIFKKEMAAFLSSFTAYVAICFFLLATGLFLWVFPDSSILDYGYAGLDSLFNLAPYLFMFLVPAICMRSFSEERKEGTFELLLTRPLTDWQIVLGKYMACLTVVLMALVPTFFYYYSVYELGIVKGNLDRGAVLGSYIGLFFLGAIFSSIGNFASVVTTNQVIAFILAISGCFISFSGFESLSKLASLQSVASWVTAIGIQEHYQSISRGVLDTRDLTYFLSFISLFLLATKTVLGGRKW